MSLLNTFLEVKSIHFHNRRWQHYCGGYRTVTYIVLNDRFIHKIDNTNTLSFDKYSWVQDAAYWLKINNYHSIEILNTVQIWSGNYATYGKSFALRHAPIINSIIYTFNDVDVKRKKDLFVEYHEDLETTIEADQDLKRLVKTHFVKPIFKTTMKTNP